LLWEWVYLAIIMDVYTRAIRGWHLSRSLEGELTLTALQGALADRMPTIRYATAIRVSNTRPPTTWTCCKIIMSRLA
jgi:transposase InsO family protein